jgi:hypothetical protein
MAASRSGGRGRPRDPHDVECATCKDTGEWCVTCLQPRGECECRDRNIRLERCPDCTTEKNPGI